MESSENSRQEIVRESLRYERTGYFALRAPASGAAGCDIVLLALHGWGQSARWFARRFEPLDDMPILVAAPQGPHQFYLDIGTKKVGFNWLSAYEKQDNIDDANRLFEAVLQEATARMGVASPQVYVLGFSQGSAMAWRFAAYAADRIAGLVACCADLPPDVAEQLPHRPHFRTLLAYGIDDAIIPQEKVDEAQRVLTEIGWQYDVLEFEGGHDLPPDVIREIGQWVSGTLPE